MMPGRPPPGGMTQDDRWRADALDWGYKLPPPAPWPLRLPIIRHVRWFWNAWQVERWAEAWGSVGIGVGGSNPYDRWVLYAIYRGWC